MSIDGAGVVSIERTVEARNAAEIHPKSFIVKARAIARPSDMTGQNIEDIRRNMSLPQRETVTSLIVRSVEDQFYATALRRRSTDY